MRYSSLKLSFAEEGLVGDDQLSKDFLSYLPDGYSIEVTIPDGVEEVNVNEIKVAFMLPDDHDISFDSFSFMRTKIYDRLKVATNLPHDLLDEISGCNYSKMEEFSYLLMFYLKMIRETEDTGAGPNVTGCLTRSELAFIVCDLISIKLDDSYLLNLTRGLLGVDKTEQNLIQKCENISKKHQAYALKAWYPETSYREISKHLNVNVSSISRWFQEVNIDELGYEISPSEIMKYWGNYKSKSAKDIADHFSVKEGFIKELEANDFYNSFKRKIANLPKEHYIEIINFSNTFKKQ